MRRVIGGVQIDDDGRRPLPSGADEQLGQIVVEELQALRLGGIDLAQHLTLFEGEFRLASGESLMKAGQGRAAGQRPLGAGRDIGYGLEKWVVAELLGVVAV